MLILTCKAYALQSGDSGSEGSHGGKLPEHLPGDVREALVAHLRRLTSPELTDMDVCRLGRRLDSAGGWRGVSHGQRVKDSGVAGGGVDEFEEALAAAAAAAARGRRWSRAHDAAAAAAFLSCWRGLHHARNVSFATVCL